MVKNMDKNIDNVRMLPDHFSIGHVNFTKIDGEYKKWSIYAKYDPILDYEDYLAFKYKTTTVDYQERQVRPVPEYERNNGWFKECDNEDDAYNWLIEKGLIKK